MSSEELKPIRGEDTVFGRLYYESTDYAALEAENARLHERNDSLARDLALCAVERERFRAQLAAIQGGMGEVVADDPIRDIAKQLHIQTLGNGLLAKIRQTIELLQEAAAERDALRAELAEVKGRQTAAWLPIETAPRDGRMALVYRPLARNSKDEPVAVKRLIGGNNHCWESTVPDGATPTNPTDGSCHVTHWMPFPAAPGEHIHTTPPAATSEAQANTSEAAPGVVGLVKALEAAFPLLDDNGLDAELHHCEWNIQQERKRLHAALSAWRQAQVKP